jgi:hypothetical protein
MGQQFNSEFERVKGSCVTLVSQVRCPHHFQNPTVEMDGESFDDFSIEVIPCCSEFQKRVEEALDKLLGERGSIVAPAAVITKPNPCIKYSGANISPTPTTPVSTVSIRRF